MQTRTRMTPEERSIALGSEIAAAALALDSTHRLGEQGPRTYLARKRVAAALDADKLPRPVDVRWLQNTAEVER